MWSSQDLADTHPFSSCSRFKCLGTDAAHVAVTARWIVERLDVVRDISGAFKRFTTISVIAFGSRIQALPRASGSRVKSPALTIVSNIARHRRVPKLGRPQLIPTTASEM
jgi:hypothetical protein